MAQQGINWKGGGNFRKLLAQMADKLGKGSSVSVGFFENERYTPVHPIRGTKRQPIPVAQAAFWNEFGTSRAPARPFFRTAVHAGQGYWGKDLADIAKATGYDSHKAMSLMGVIIKDAVVQSIVAWSQPPNAKRTVEIKGFNKPLIDDGTMQRAVGFQVKAGK